MKKQNIPEMLYLTNQLNLEKGPGNYKLNPAVFKYEKTITSEDEYLDIKAYHRLCDFDTSEKYIETFITKLKKVDRVIIQKTDYGYYTINQLTPIYFNKNDLFIYKIEGIMLPNPKAQTSIEKRKKNIDQKEKYCKNSKYLKSISTLSIVLDKEKILTMLKKEAVDNKYIQDLLNKNMYIDIR